MKVNDKISYLGNEYVVTHVTTEYIGISMYHETEKFFWKNNKKEYYSYQNDIRGLILKDNFKYIKGFKWT